MQKLFFKQPTVRLISPDLSSHIVSLTLISDNNWYYDRHSHADLAEIMFVEKGLAEYTLDNVSYVLEAGDIAIINSGTVHSESTVHGSELKLWALSTQNLSFFGLGPNKLIRDDMSPIVKAGESYQYLIGRFERLHNERKFPQMHSDEICQYIFADIILNLSRILNNIDTKMPRRSNVTLVNDVKAFIDVNYGTSITLDMLSQHFFVSPSYIAHEVKKEMGISPINYLISRRIGEAQRLLLSTDSTITAIAEQVGYDNIHYFSKLFSKRIGCSPVEFRAKYQIEKAQ